MTLGRVGDGKKKKKNQKKEATASHQTGQRQTVPAPNPKAAAVERAAGRSRRSNEARQCEALRLS
jgi:hypothetical protein